MIVVSDTGPVNYLALIGHLDVLPKLYDTVVIPPAVARELGNQRSPELVRNFISNAPAWLRVETAPEPDPELFMLGEGEQQAISLARSLLADLLLCDDRDAREVASRRSIEVVGTLGVLQEASENGLLCLHRAISSLRQTNFRMTPRLVEDILRLPLDDSTPP